MHWHSCSNFEWGIMWVHVISYWGRHGNETNQSCFCRFFSRYCILLSYLEIHDEIDGFIHLVIWNCIRHIDRKIQFRQLFTSLSSMLFASNQNSSNQLSDGLFFTFQCMDCVECKKKTFAWNRQIEMVWEMKGTSIWDLNRGIWLLIFEHLSKLLKCGN